MKKLIKEKIPSLFVPGTSSPALKISKRFIWAGSVASNLKFPGEGNFSMQLHRIHKFALLSSLVGKVWLI